MSKLTNGKDRLRAWLRQLSTNPHGAWLERSYDYSGPDDAGAEVCRAFEVALRKHNIRHSWNPEARPVRSFETLACGFCTGLAALPQQHRWLDGTVVFHNVAPRKKVTQGTKHGEKYYVGLVQNGDWGETLVAGVNAGYDWSFVKPHLTALAVVERSDAGYQFRSCDLYPDWTARILAGDLADVKFFDSVEEAEIADVPPLSVARIDSFGNAKLTVHDGEFPFGDGQRVRIRVNGHPKQLEGIVQRSINFAAGEGNLSCGAGSSIFVGIDRRRFMELFLVGGDAADSFMLASETHLHFEAIEGDAQGQAAPADAHNAIPVG